MKRLSYVVIRVIKNKMKILRRSRKNKVEWNCGYDNGSGDEGSIKYWGFRVFYKGERLEKMVMEWRKWMKVKKKKKGERKRVREEWERKESEKYEVFGGVFRCHLKGSKIGLQSFLKGIFKFKRSRNE